MTQQFVVEHAKKLFLLHGYKTVTMDEIASELGISKKTLYEGFGSKENLIMACLDLQYQEIKYICNAVLQEKLDAVEEFLTIKDKISSIFNTPQHKVSKTQLQKYYPKLFQRVFMNQSKFIQEIMQTNILKGQEQGLYREQVNAANFCEMMLFTQNSLKNKEDYLINMEKMDCLSEMHFDVMLRGILTEKGLEIFKNFTNVTK